MSPFRYVGGWNRYQLHLLLIFFPFTMFLAYVSYTPILFLYVPDHWCTPDPILLNSSLSMDKILELAIPPGEEENQHLPRAQCHMYQADWEQVSFTGFTEFEGKGFLFPVFEKSEICQHKFLIQSAN
jgi:hypothetical protein